MAIPVRAQPAAPDSNLLAPPTPVPWSHTSVSIIGRNGQGEEIPLTALQGSKWPNAIMQPGATGLDMPPFGVFSDESPNLDGSIFRSARAAAREVMIPVYLHGIDRQTVNAMKRKFFQSLNPKRGYCLIRFTEGNGRSRQLTAYYKGGMEGAEGEAGGFTWAKYGLQFTAMDPWFYPTTWQTSKWSFGAGDPLLSTINSFFPLHISDGVLGGAGEALTISNPGDIEAWPVWKLYGPIKSFTLDSPDGDSITASPPSDGTDLVATGRVLTIDTRPGRKTVRDDRGVNYWAKLDAAPQFWSVEPGDTSASISVVTGSGKASVVLTFQPRYASFI
ncbi:phage tail domain-containing protein [Streptomyces sp. NPDC050095]|uniref:phage tail domain-containing protein n=1 Tax=unclassified Streptomyces TaxID=2593676 RepID=UPI0034196F85